MNTHTLELDLSKDGLGAGLVRVGQGDKHGTTIKALIYDGGAEAGLYGLAGCVVERRAVDLDGRARRDAEGLDLRGVELAVFDLVFFCKQENKILLADVDLTVPVVLKAVELRVIAPAHADLMGKPP
mgnify:CR=1 FL=1